MSNWKTTTPPVGKDILVLTVLFDDDSHRTFDIDDIIGPNRSIDIATYTKRGTFHLRNYQHSSGDPYPAVVAWKEFEDTDFGESFYDKCIGVCE